MPFRAITLSDVPETAYLHAENTFRYRAIMRVFFQESQVPRMRLDKFEVMSILREDERFQTYTMEQLEQDLGALCAWKNLIPIQDPHRPASIEEYKNKQFSYSMSQAAAEVERMTIRLEEIGLRTTALSTRLFVRILNTLETLTGQAGLEPQALAQHWQSLQVDFQQLTNNYQDYLRDFYSSHAEHILKTEEFLVHKDQVIRYLRDFVLELQGHTEQIRNLLETFPQPRIKALLDDVFAALLDAGRGRLIQRDEHYEEDLRQQVDRFWATFYAWFVPGKNGQSDSQHVMEVTNDIIQRILMNVELIIQAHSGGANRKGEYRKFLELFANCADLQEAHKLAGMVFGAQQAIHLRGLDPEEVYETGSCHDFQPFVFQLHNRQRPGRPPSEKSFFPSKSMEKAAQRTLYLEKQKQERAQLEHYIRSGRLDFSALDEVITPQTRRSFLNWIVKANANGSKRARTEFGQAYTLTCRPGETCVLHCTDGDLTMPAYCLTFDTEEGHG